MSEESKKEFLTAKEVVNLLDGTYSYRWLLEQTKAGKIPCVKLGTGKRIYRRSMILKLLEDGMQGGSDSEVGDS